MLGNAGIYAVKKRKKPVQKPKKLPGVDGAKSNPSKRHRDRLNGELDRLTSLLPFPEDVCSRLDKLSVLRLSVGYLKVKSFFKATMKKNSVVFPSGNGLSMNLMDATSLTEGDLLLQALSGFVLVVTAEGHVFYASPTIQDYLGFHQCDVVHQSVFELIHTGDRAMFRRQLHFALNPMPFGPEQGGDVMQSSSDITRNIVNYDPQQLPPENSSFLERTFVCRFRCLLDNSSGFLALNFQGRLKYLHGLSMTNEDGSRSQPQLALFSIVTPVQPPSILEIRAKTLLFQTKHKLDFTPTGIDTRGKVFLGYSEIELCMRGSGYQFVHAADMMYCADNHVRMMKTGESGLTVFRLLSKTGAWVWVQANAKLVYKGGRADFIIARQRALVNAEGEEHLRQRKTQLPFSFTTGDAVLYETGPTLDPTEFTTDSRVPMIPKGLDQSVDSQSLLGSLFKQDPSVYTQPVDAPLPFDQAFMDSCALVSVPGDPLDSIASMANGVKDEDEGTVEAMISTLGNLAQDGDLCSALQGLEVVPAELMEWESTLLKLSQDVHGKEGNSELDRLLTNDIFSYVEDILFRESSVDFTPFSYVGTVNNNLGESYSEADVPSDGGLHTPQLLQNHVFNHTHSPVRARCAQGTNNGPGNAEGGLTEYSPILSGAPPLSHFESPVPQPSMNVPTYQQPLQLKDIFTPSLELPELSVPTTSGRNGSVTFDGRTAGSCAWAPLNTTDSTQGIPSHICTKPSPQHRSRPGLHILAHGQPHDSVQAPQHAAATLVDTYMVSHNGFSSPYFEPNNLNMCSPFPAARLKGGTAFQTHVNDRNQQWPQDQRDKLPPSSLTQNGHKPTYSCHSQGPESQTAPPAGPWPQHIDGLYHAPQVRLENGLPASNTCMFEKRSTPFSNGNLVNGTRIAPSPPSCQRRTDERSPTQGSCYIQWRPSETVVGTSAIPQDDARISPPSGSFLPHMSTPGSILAMKHYLQGPHVQTQIPSVPTDCNGSLSAPSLLDGNMYF